jgi:acetolactate synthase-1/2/3 large subunit
MTAMALHEAAWRLDRPPQTVSQAIVNALESLGVRQAFGVSGGAVAALWGALSASNIELVHFRHETGAAFAAIEAHFVTDAPVVVFTTTGPGLTNALTGLLAARGEGAKIILLSACTTAAHRGRWAIQETDNDTMPLGLTAPGALFHLATVIESAEALPQIFRRLANGLARPGGFIKRSASRTRCRGSWRRPRRLGHRNRWSQNARHCWRKARSRSGWGTAPGPPPMASALWRSGSAPR